MCHAQPIISSEKKGQVGTCKLLILLQSSLSTFIHSYYPAFELITSLWRVVRIMSSTILKAAILVISDTASQNPATDTTGNVLKEVFSSDGQGQWEVIETKIVPDDFNQIQSAVTQWADQDMPANLIVTSGGTGFAVKDNTPEVRSDSSQVIEHS